MALPSSAHEFSPSQRVEQLNAIDKDVALLLHSASTALKSLTNAPPPPPSDPSASAPSPPGATNPTPTLTTHQTAFTTSVHTYFSLLSSIDVRLRRQVYALEEADIIAPLEPLPSYAATGPRDAGTTTTSFSSNASGSTVAGSVGDDEAAGRDEDGDGAGGPKSGIYGGQGPLGVGELNGRVDGVGRDMERELWEQARVVMEGWEKNGQGRGEEKGDSMEVDGESS